jgi:hypothetical protein
MTQYNPSDLNKYQASIKFCHTTDELHGLVNKIIEHFGSFPHALLPAYKKRLGGHIAPVSSTLCRIIVDTDSRKLYAQYKSYLTESDVLNMMNSGFYHEELEEKFCQQTYQWIKTQAYKSVSAPTWIISELNALAASGRALTLDTMDILWEEVNQAIREIQSDGDFFDTMYLEHLKERIPEWKKMIAN